MKKIVIISSILAVIATSSAYAKTEGNYADLSVIRSSQKLKNTDGKDNDSAVGFGASYKYAVNMNGFFVSPGLFYDRVGTEIKNSSSVDGQDGSSELNVDNRYGVKLDAGYDISDNFSAYLTGGVSYVSYVNKVGTTFDDGEVSDSSSSKNSKNVLSPFYGAGLTYKISKDVALFAEYTMQNFDVKNKAAASTGDFAGTGFADIDAGKTKSKLNIARVGVAYHF